MQVNALTDNKSIEKHSTWLGFDFRIFATFTT